MLRKLQEDFRDCIFKSTHSYNLAKNIQENGISCDARLNIYKNNVFSNATKALLAIYPKTALWVGEDFFKHTCQNFIKKHPPYSGIFIEYGEFFGNFLAKIPEMKQFPFIPDLAKFEWLIHKSHHAEQEFGITAKDCANKVHNDNFALRLRKDVFLQESNYNLLEIFNSNAPELIKSYILILRDNFEVKYRAISKEEFQTLSNINKGEPSIIAKYLNLGLFNAINHHRED